MSFRNAIVEDYQWMYDIFSLSKNVQKFGPSFKQFSRWLENAVVYVIDNNKGFVYLYDNNECGIFLDNSLKGTGIYEKAFVYLFKNNPRPYFWGRMRFDNPAAIKAATKFGLIPKGLVMGLDWKEFEKKYL